MSDLQRTHTCGQLRKTDAGSEVTLSGWVDTRRVLVTGQKRKEKDMKKNSEEKFIKVCGKKLMI